MTTESFEEVLGTYSLLARFRVPDADEQLAPGQVAQRLTATDLAFHEVDVERVEPDGTVLVVVRFVEASVDGETALAGLFETLSAAGLSPDEVWLERAFS